MKMSLRYRKKEVVEPTPEPKKEIVLAPKEVTKRLLRGSLCESCIHRLLRTPSQHCAVVPKEPTLKEQCTCPNYEKNQNQNSQHQSSHYNPPMSGMTFTVSSGCAPSLGNSGGGGSGSLGFSGLGFGGGGGAGSSTIAVTGTYGGWPFPQPPMVPKTTPKTVMHNMNELEKKVKEYK